RPRAPDFTGSTGCLRKSEIRGPKLEGIPNDEFRMTRDECRFPSGFAASVFGPPSPRDSNWKPIRAIRAIRGSTPWRIFTSGFTSFQPGLLFVICIPDPGMHGLCHL